jgi:outer membrane protein OmpA-like peptidoglycan-associated protein
MFRAHAGATLLVVLIGCSKPVVFQGARTLAIAGQPPPPPVTPAPEPPRVEVRDNKIEIREKIQFEVDKATIMAVSFSLLDEIAAVIQKNPHIKKIQIEGHASSEGGARHNQKLSDARANAVMKYLTEHGIAQAALVARGFGIEKPLADNATEEGREKNRRVEFNILEQDVTSKKIEIDPRTGKEKVLEESKQTLQPATPAKPAATSSNERRHP